MLAHKMLIYFNISLHTETDVTFKVQETQTQKHCRNNLLLSIVFKINVVANEFLMNRVDNTAILLSGRGLSNFPFTCFISLVFPYIYITHTSHSKFSKL